MTWHGSIDSLIHKNASYIGLFVLQQTILHKYDKLKMRKYAEVLYMSKAIKRIIAAVIAVIAIIVIAFAGLYFTRFQTIGTIEKLTDYDDYNIYRMDVKYNYDLDKIIDHGITDTQSMIDGIVSEALPYLPISIKVPSFGCSAFSVHDNDGNVLMGRNYDFKYDTSALMVYCAPENGYRSVAFAALNNIGADDPEAGLSKKMACLTAPFICLDGMNEKGVSIAVLTLDSEPTFQQTGKPVIATSLAIRLVLDKAATTKEAVELLKGYDMFAANGRDYHFYITDATGDGCIVEYDCDSEEREMTVTPSRSVTNFFVMYKDRVLPDQHNDPYGHGRERYDSMEAIFDAAGNTGITRDIAWDALKAASQEPKEGDVTSNTQWSILYNDTWLNAEIVLRRHWDDVNAFALEHD